jgi:hypothetical protein
MPLDLIEPPQAETKAPPPVRALSVVEYLITTGAKPEDVRAALELQVKADNHQLALLIERRKMDKEDREEAGRLAFREGMAKFRGRNVIIPKSKFVDRGKAGSFYHSEFDEVCRLLSPALSECGFSFRHDMRFSSKRWMTEGVESDLPWVYVTCYLDHAGGHSERLDLDGPPGDQQANTAVQNMQITATVLKRQTLLAITGTATGGDDDEGALKAKAKQPDQNASALEFELLIDAGREASMGGMAKLNAWWGGLTAKQRNGRETMAEYGRMRRAAAEADKRGGA